MREIFFRGERKDSGEWVFGMAWIFKEKTMICPWRKGMCKYDTGYYPVEVSPETFGQYTGLTDKNGVKMFEGDIVKFAKNIYQIIFECGSFALLDIDGEMITKIGGLNDHCYSLMNLHLECCWEDDCAYDIEVIGNIHDNPELLKGGEPDA